MEIREGKRRDILKHTVLKVLESNVEGDIVEIGCFKGENSKWLAEQAQNFNRRLICIDLWPAPKYAPRKNDFLENIMENSEVVDIFHNDSKSVIVKNKLENTKIAVALVDGNHSLEYAKYDLELVKHSQGCILFDDCNIEGFVNIFDNFCEKYNLRNKYNFADYNGSWSHIGAAWKQK